MSLKEEALVQPVVGLKVADSAPSLQVMVWVRKLPRSAWGSITHYLIGVDNVLEMTIVTADGNHVISNAYLNSDLFWALRGGGGGTWGVVTSVTYKLTPPLLSLPLPFQSIPRTLTQPRTC